MNRRWLVGVTLLGILPLASCTKGGGDADAYILSAHGTVVVSGVHVATFHGGRHQLSVGDTVRVTNGSATLSLPAKASLELRAGRNDATVKVAAIPTVVDGDVLAVATKSGVRVEAGAGLIHVVDGAARLRRSSGVTVAVYEGSATVEALGQQLITPALRQASVSDSGALPVHAVPLVYDRSHPDPWDVRYLGDAIDLGTQLARRSRALTAALPTPLANAAFITKVVPPLRTVHGFDDSFVDSTRSVGETVVGASIALAGNGDFAKRWSKAFSFRSEGADWGLVALDEQARRGAVVSVLDSVLNGVTATFVSTGATVPRTSGTTSTTVAGRRSATTTSTTSPPSSPGTSIPPLTIPPLPVPQSPPSTPTTPTTLLPALPDPLEQLLGPILKEEHRPTEEEHRVVPSPEWPKTPSAPKTSHESSSRRASGGSTSTKSVRSSHK